MEVVTRTCCLIVDNMSKFLEDIAAVIPSMSRFKPFVKASWEEVFNPDAQLYFLDISTNRICGDEGGVTSLRDGGVLWAHA